MNTCLIKQTSLLATPLPKDTNGTPRYLIPARRFSVIPGSKLAKDAGLKEYRGRTKEASFVFSTNDLISTLFQTYALLDELSPEGAPHALRSDGPLFVLLELPQAAYAYLTEMFASSTPWLTYQSEMTSVLSIPAGLSKTEQEKAATMIMTFPALRAAAVKYLEYNTPEQYYGFEFQIRLGGRMHKARLVNDIHRDRATISLFLAQDEPLSR